ncbi:HD domain-containing protein [Thermococcus barophilus]|uniref:HD domain-containing protein n=1 Tax=Thermococcus barophilus TaxID=55802 RepID=UPI0001805644|nr:HD domain-containing protein [Thermococcus barophilus]
MDKSIDYTHLAKFLLEIGNLKNIPRSGWLFAGIQLPESVADHTFRTSIIGVILANLENVDMNKVVLMCLLHDLAEVRLLDLPARAKKYIKNKEELEKEIMKDLIDNLPTSIKRIFFDTFNEYQEKKSKEAIITHDADKLDMLLQAIEYSKQGYNTEEWIKDVLSSLITPTAKRIADVILRCKE